MTSSSIHAVLALCALAQVPARAADVGQWEVFEASYESEKTYDKRHFEHADGTPFFWLGDTWWKCLCKRMTWEGFQELTAAQHQNGFRPIAKKAVPAVAMRGVGKPFRDPLEDSFLLIRDPTSHRFVQRLRDLPGPHAEPSHVVGRTG